MSSDESSSEDENAEKFKEAVWRPRTNEMHDSEKDAERNVKVSNRVEVSRHEHDANELQTTPEFRSHVSRKLAAMLDSLLTEVTSGTPDPKPDLREAGGEEQDGAGPGFRLFSTSLPGRWWKEPTPPPPSRRPPAPSSSDSDSEMELRLREAAVCVSDLLSPSTEKPQENGERGASTTGSSPLMKKKKKKKKKRRRRREGPPEGREGEESVSDPDRVIPHEPRLSQEPSSEEHVVKRRKSKVKDHRLR